MESLKTRDKHLTKAWYIAGLSHEVKKDKAFVSTIYDEQLLLYRDENGKPICVLDRCIHRHALLSAGEIKSGCIRCPYHGWQFDKEGFLIDVPSEEKPRKKSKAYQLKPYPVVEQDGCVWVWMGEGNPSPSAPAYRFPKLQEKAWTHYFMTTDFENEVTHLAENFMDVPHTVFVHDKWFRTQKAQKKRVPIGVTVSNGEVLINYKDESDNVGFTGKILNPKNDPVSHTDLFIMPNITRVDYNFGSNKSFIISSQITPISTLKSRVYTAIIYNLGLITLPLKPFFRFYTRQVINQDVDIMANQAESFRVHEGIQFHSTEADIVHLSIEKLRKMGIEGDSKLYEYKMSTDRCIWR